MKLQWLPEPSPRGGWNDKEWTGRDRFGQERASVSFRDSRDSSGEWRGDLAPVPKAKFDWDAMYRLLKGDDRKSVMLALEALIPDEET